MKQRYVRNLWPLVATIVVLLAPGPAAAAADPDVVPDVCAMVCTTESCDGFGATGYCSGGDVRRPKNCGNGRLDGREQCDDGNAIDDDTCSNRCKTVSSDPAFCGNGRRDRGEECDDGDSIATDSCSNDCRRVPGDPRLFGNGRLDPGEECDDGNLIDDDGCSNCCVPPPPPPPLAFCGDGTRDRGEECDDGNRVGGDGCSAACYIEPPLCGNGLRDPGEECDDGNRLSGDGCSETCRTCGNARVDTGEECDDGNSNDNDQCRNDCTLPLAVCGNKILESGEGCDDGNRNDDDSCPANCMPLPRDCGNGKRESGEQCDDGNRINDDRCRNNCTRPPPVCGNGFLEPDEQCDDGNRIDHDGCDVLCITEPEYCGDGLIQRRYGEQCDEGERNADDGQCRTDCKINPRAKPVCGDGMAQRGEQCDETGKLLVTGKVPDTGKELVTAKERAAKQRAALELAEKKRIAQELAEKERAERERVAQELAEKERAERERVAQELAEKERAERERVERERAEKERIAQELAEKERVERELAEKADKDGQGTSDGQDGGGAGAGGVDGKKTTDDGPKTSDKKVWWWMLAALVLLSFGLLWWWLHRAGYDLKRAFGFGLYKRGRVGPVCAAGMPALRELQKKIQPISPKNADVARELFLAYRSWRAWPEMFVLYDILPQPLKTDLEIRQQYAFALNRSGRDAEAEVILKELRDKYGPCAETCGILARVYKDRWEKAWRSGAEVEGPPLDLAIATYLEGHDAEPVNPYCGINVLTLIEFSAKWHDQLCDRLVAEVSAALEADCESNDYWVQATRLELAIHLDREHEARAALPRIEEAMKPPTVCCPERWKVMTTYRNLQLIADARQRRGDEIPAWVASLLTALRLNLEQRPEQSADSKA